MGAGISTRGLQFPQFPLFYFIMRGPVLGPAREVPSLTRHRAPDALSYVGGLPTGCPSLETLIFSASVATLHDFQESHASD